MDIWELSDETLEKKIRDSAVIRRYDGLQDWVLELIRRYEILKTACGGDLDEILRRSI